MIKKIVTEIFRKRQEKYLTRKLVLRFFYYMIGMIVLALGITLNTKTGLGVSPIISVPYCIATIFHLNFGNITFLVYVLFVLAEWIMNRHAKVFLQLPVALVFTRFMNLFNQFIQISFSGFISNLILLVIAVILTGIGAAMSLNMRLVPNPGDGIVQALADFFHKEVGFMKNCFDLSCICTTMLLAFLFTGHLIGIGVGTVIAVIGVGRTIALFNSLFRPGMNQSAGILPAA